MDRIDRDYPCTECGDSCTCRRIGCLRSARDDGPTPAPNTDAHRIAHLREKLDRATRGKNDVKKENKRLREALREHDQFIRALHESFAAADAAMREAYDLVAAKDHVGALRVLARGSAEIAGALEETDA